MAPSAHGKGEAFENKNEMGIERSRKRGRETHRQMNQLDGRWEGRLPQHPRPGFSPSLGSSQLPWCCGILLLLWKDVFRLLMLQSISVTMERCAAFVYTA